MAVHIGGRGPGHLARSGSLWTPNSLGASLLGWLDAEQDATITQSSGAVSAWKDAVDTSRSFAQATGANQPAYSATSFNGRPGITFDGTNDELTLGSVPYPSVAVACEIWALIDQTALVADTGTREIFNYGGTGNDTRRIRRTVATSVNRAGISVGTGAGNTTANNTGVDMSGRCIVRGRFDGTNIGVDVNGTAGSDTAAVPATGTTRSRVGATTAASPAFFFQGVINTILIISTPTAAQAAALLAWLNRRKG